MLRRPLLAVLLILTFGLPVSAQEWARKMFEIHSHDFGSVARGAKTEFKFVLTNIYVEDIHISSARASCGCTSVRIEEPTLKTYEQGAIVAHFNTGSFLGKKGATITVTLDKPFPAQIQLQAKGYIRSDVVLDPGSVQFGSVEQGTAADRTVGISYAGRSDWKIMGVNSSNPYLSAEITETRRGGGQIAYQLSVHLDEHAPPGYLQDHLTLITNDRRLTQVPVPIEGKVQSAITVSPASLFMGVVEPGKKVTKQLVVQGKQPFRIISISCDDESFEFDTSANDEPKTLHLIPVTFVAGEDRGKVSRTIRIETDFGNAAPELSAYAVVTP